LLGGTYSRFDVGSCASDSFYLTIRGVRVGAADIADIRSGAPTRVVEDGSRHQYRVLVPLQRTVEVELRGRLFDCHSGRGVVVSPNFSHAIRSEAGAERLWLSIDEAAVTRVASALLGAGLDCPIAFDPTIDLARPETRSLFRAVAFAVRELCDDASLFRVPRLRSELEETIVTALLLGQPHSHRDRMVRLDGQIASRDVVRAVDYIRTNLATSITLPDLVAVSGVPGRTLRQHFRRFHGMSPMGYVRKARFERARALLQHEPGLSVTEAAGRAGFDHLGRFTAGYRRCFGEAPSETAGRSAGRRH
jgi:AraC-like DNA-binding protein